MTGRRPVDGPGEAAGAGAAVLLSAAGVHAGYPGGPAVLTGADLTVRPGARLAVLGVNGSGKTTLLRCLSGAHRPAGGQVRWRGEPLRHRRAGLARHRQRVQLVLQDPDDQLVAAEVARDVSYGPVNLGLPEEEVRARVAEALALVGIEHLGDRPAHLLSYGERKRTAVAGALAMRPEVLLLDEPSAGLDPAGTAALREALAAVERHGTTVVLSTHDVDLAWSWAEEVALVAGGRVRQGPTGRVLADAGALARCGLAPPWVVQLLTELGLAVPGTGADRPRDAAAVAALLPLPGVARRGR